MKKNSIIALAAMFAALCLVILSFGSLFQTLDVSLAVLAGLVILIVSIEFADPVAWSVWAVAGLVSFLFPVKTAGILFFGFFGWYPICQKKFNMRAPVLARVYKFLVFNVLTVIYLLLSAFVTGTEESKIIYITLLVIANIFFYVYDMLLDRFMIFYLVKIRPRLRWK